MPKLMVEKGKAVAPEFVLEDGDWIVGRSAKADIRIKEIDVSREHCRLSVFGDEVEVENLSKKGTRIDGHKLEGRARLADGMRLKISPSTTLVYRLDIHATPMPADSGSKDGVISFINREGDTEADEDVFLSMDGRAPTPPTLPPEKVQPAFPEAQEPEEDDPVEDVFFSQADPAGAGKSPSEVVAEQAAAETPAAPDEGEEFDPFLSVVSTPEAPTGKPKLDPLPEWNEVGATPTSAPTERGEPSPDSWEPLRAEAPRSIIEPIAPPVPEEAPSAGFQTTQAPSNSGLSTTGALTSPTMQLPDSGPAPPVRQEGETVADVWGSVGQPGQERRSRTRKVLVVLFKVVVILVFIGAVTGILYLLTVKKESILGESDPVVYLSRAADEAAAANFNKALRLLERVDRQDSGIEARKQAREMEELVKEWRFNSQTLERAREAFLRDQLEDPVLDDLQALTTEESRGWSWSQAGEVERLEAAAAREVLGLHKDLRSPTARARISPVDLARVRGAIGAVKIKRGGELPGFLLAAWPKVERNTEQLLASAVKRVEKAPNLPGLASWPPDLEPVRSELNSRLEVATEAEKPVLVEQLALTDALAMTMKQYRAGAALVADMDFKGIAIMQVAAPPVAPFSRFYEFAAARDTLEKKIADLRKCARQLWEMEQRYGQNNETPEPLRAWDQDQLAQLNAVMACDTLDLPFAGYLRTEAQGAYDRYLGIEDFHAYLCDLSGEIRLRQFDTPFETEMDKARAFYEDLDRFLGLIERCGDASWRTGSAANFLERFQEMKVRQENLVQWCVKRADKFLEQGQQRSAMIAAGLALGLSSTPESLSLKNGMPLESWLRDQYRLQRRLSQELYRLWLHEPQFKRATLRQDYLARSLPGTAQTDAVWKSTAP